MKESNIPIKRKSIIVAGYPKSGNTMILDALKYAGNSINKNYLGGYNLPKLLRTKIIPAPNPLFKEQMTEIKSHRDYPKLHDVFLDNIKKVILIRRKPIHVFASYLDYNIRKAYIAKGKNENYLNYIRHHLKTLWELKIAKIPLNYDQLIRSYQKTIKYSFNKSAEIFLNLNGEIKYLKKISGNWLNYYESFSKVKVPIFKIQYEELIDNNKKNQIIKDLAIFLSVDYEILSKGFNIQSQIAKKNSLENPKDSFYKKLGAREELLNIDKGLLIKEKKLIEMNSSWLD
tara:strand:+ start:2145 stop:3005 length:861 start_codon:yes stop_codon:yes gene_type:complete